MPGSVQDPVEIRSNGTVNGERPTRRPQTLPRSFNPFRPNAFGNLIPSRRSHRLSSFPSMESFHSSNGSTPTTPSTPSSPLTPATPNNEKALQVATAFPALVKESSKKGWNSIVTVVLIEAKGLPDPPSDRSSHSLYCKIKLGTETTKSKAVKSSTHPEWRERFKLHLNKDHLLRISLWDKGKQKNFMGSCMVDLSTLQKERTHDMWQLLEDGFGSIHFNLTTCAVRNVSVESNGTSVEQIKETYDFTNFNDWQSVGNLHVKVIGARGLSGKPSAYCQLEVENERVQTHSVKSASEPVWNKSYIFGSPSQMRHQVPYPSSRSRSPSLARQPSAYNIINVRDVSSTLDLKVYDTSLVSTFRTEHLGKVSIPLLRINNGETRWYALKDKSQRHIAKGNCPRVLLQMSLIYNPIKASLRLLRPAEVKLVRKTPSKYDLDLAIVYSNLMFVKGTFDGLVKLNDGIKIVFEWDNRELSTIVLIGWLLFWYNVRLWHIPLLAIVPFIFFWFYRKHQYHQTFLRVHKDDGEKVIVEKEDQNEPGLATKLAGLPEANLFILKCIEYMESVSQRINNLIMFKVPFLSYFAILFLLGLSISLYLFPFNYFPMAFGLYKYTRKILYPNRQLNHDFLDFISRIPDDETLKDWEELSVPEPNHHKSAAGVLVRSQSNAT